MLKTIYDKRKFTYNAETNTIKTNELSFGGKFDTEIQILNSETGGSCLFSFTEMTGSEWDPATKCIYHSVSGIKLEVSQDAELTEIRAKAYLKAKMRH